MNERVKVHNQNELDACIHAGNIAIVIGCSVVASGNSSVEARDNSSVEALGNSSVVAWDNSSVIAWGNSSVEARGNSSVEARDNSSVEAWDNSSVVARDNSSVVVWDNSSVVVWDNSSVKAWDNSSVIARGNSSVIARDNSSVEAWGNSSVEAWGNSSVEARDNSSVVAWDNVFMRLFSALRIKASPHVVIMIHGHAESVEGGNQITALAESATGAEWCEYYGIDRANAPFIVPNIDAAILAAIDMQKAINGLDMSTWHGASCDETNWCNTTHCRAGYAICLAGAPGFALERRYGSLIAGNMIYAASRPDKPLPDFHATTQEALADIRRAAGAVGKGDVE